MLTSPSAQQHELPGMLPSKLNATARGHLPQKTSRIPSSFNGMPGPLGPGLTTFDRGSRQGTAAGSGSRSSRPPELVSQPPPPSPTHLQEAPSLRAPCGQPH